MKLFRFLFFFSFLITQFIFAQTDDKKVDQQNPFDEVKAKIIESQLIFTNWFFLQYQTIQFQVITKKPIAASSAYNEDLNEFNKIVNTILPQKTKDIKEASWDFLNEDEKNFLLETSSVTNNLFSLEEEAINVIGNLQSSEEIEIMANIHYQLYAGKIDSLFKKIIKNYSYLSSIVNQRQYENIVKEKDEKNSLKVITNISFVAFQQNENRKFEKVNYNLQDNDFIYLFSDGFADQFGGNDGKKLMSKKFKEYLLSINSFSTIEQQKKLNQFILNWKGTQEQVDDILVIGIKI